MRKVSFVVLGDESKYFSIANDLMATKYSNLEVYFAVTDIKEIFSYHCINFQSTDIGKIKNIALDLISGEYVIFMHTDHIYDFTYFESIFKNINEGYQIVLIPTFKLFKKMKNIFKPSKSLKAFYFNSIYGSAFNTDLIKKHKLQFLHKNDFYFVPFLHGFLFSTYLGIFLNEQLYFSEKIVLNDPSDDAFLVSNLYLNETFFSKRKYLKVQKKFLKLIRKEQE